MAWTPFGTKPDPFWFPEGTPSFTFEEYVQTTLFPNPVAIWTDKTGETGVYFNLNMTAAIIAALRKKGETFAMLRFMMALRSAPQTLMLTALGAQTYLLGSAVHRMTSRDKMELLSGIPGKDDSLIEKLLKLSFPN